jgi:predicted enzyme related to lactoylglutathione lyase
MGPTGYTIFMNDGTPAAGMLTMPPEWAGVPPHWLIYFAVEDADAAAARAADLGGKIVMPPSESPYGRFSVVQDPQGAVFAVIALTTPGA